MNVYVTRLGLVTATTPLLFGCAQRAGSEHMWRHFDAAATLHEAIIVGSVEDARQAGRWLAQHRDTEGLPAGSEPLVDAMREQAGRIANTDDLLEAALGTARVAVACGNCHESHGRGPTFRGQGVPPTEGAGVHLEMRRHAWGAGRLWEGLVGPSDQAWVVGARALLDAPLSTEEVKKHPEIWHHVGIMETRVHELGHQALTATDDDERARLYAEVLSSCAACHVRLRGW